ncbi:MAG: hypothetical protein ACLUFI_07400 [Oscillospiraceae bacterium]
MSLKGVRCHGAVNRKFYRDNGAAAYDVYAWNDQAARQYEDGRAYEQSRQYELPEEQVREQPYRRVKSRTAIAPVHARRHADRRLSDDPRDLRLRAAV